MKKIRKIIVAGAVSPFATNYSTAQTNGVHELEVINQLSTQSAVVNMPVTKLLNAPGNEALKAFFFKDYEIPLKFATIARRNGVLPTSTLAEKLAKAPKVLTTGKHLIELDKIFGF
jgi:hypothetical protein